MPKVVVRKSYRCQPGRRREVLAALQRIDAAAASGYPRGRYLFVETRASGEPDLEVEFTFESYAEMEQLERRMREHVARFLREGGGTGQEFLLEPSGTKYLLLVEETRGAASAPAAQAPAAAAPSAPGPQGPRSSGAPGAPGAPAAPPAPAAAFSPRSGAASPAVPAARSVRALEPEPAFDDDEDEFEGLSEEDLPEPDVPPPPEVPRGMTPAQFQQSQLARARAALSGAEKAVNLGPRTGGAGGQAPGQRRPPRSDS